MSEFVHSEFSEESTIEVTITIKSESLIVREFSAYLMLADRTYGRLITDDLRSYSRTRYRQLRLSEIREGSIVLSITEAASQLREAAPYIVLVWFLRYLPVGL